MTSPPSWTPASTPPDCAIPASRSPPCPSASMTSTPTGTTPSGPCPTKHPYHHASRRHAGDTSIISSPLLSGAPFEVVDLNDASLRSLARQESGERRGERLITDLDSRERPANRPLG